jgi:hypothetical protein
VVLQGPFYGGTEGTSRPEASAPKSRPRGQFYLLGATTIAASHQIMQSTVPVRGPYIFISVFLKRDSMSVFQHYRVTRLPTDVYELSF